MTSLDSISLLSAWSIIFCAFSHSFSSLLCQLPPTFNTVCHCLCLHISDFPPFVEYVCQCCKTSQNEKEVNQWFYQMMQATSSFCSPSSVLLPCIWDMTTVTVFTYSVYLSFWFCPIVWVWTSGSWRNDLGGWNSPVVAYIP